MADGDENVFETTAGDFDAIRESHDQTSESLHNVMNLTQQYGDWLKNLSSIGGKASEQFNALTDKYDSFSQKLKNAEQLTESQVLTLGALSASLLGASDSFNTFGNIDTKGLNAFSNQLEDLEQKMLNSPIFKRAFKQMKVLGKSDAESMLAGRKAFEEFFSFSFDAMKEFAKGADQVLNLKNAYIQLSAATGNLGDVSDRLGGNFKNINSLVGQQMNLITDSAEVTNVSAAVMSEYYSILGRVPGALEAMTSGIADSTKQTSLLTAVVQYATGSGRNFADVTEDMKEAFRTYGLEGEDALNFTARISELSNKFGIELEDVRRSVLSVADTFAIFGKNADGAAALMNKYLGTLKQTGISGRVAMNIVQNMTEGIKGMTIAQKAFLSAQTGGPGGIMGGFKIEQMIREGDLESVFARVKETIERYAGDIVSVEEAATNQAAASRLIKQRALLQQGPLGDFAKDEQSASRILEAFQLMNKGQAVDFGELVEDPARESRERGLEIADQTRTEVSRIRALVEKLQASSARQSLRIADTSLTAATGSGLQVETTRSVEDMRRNMRAQVANVSSRMGDEQDRVLLSDIGEQSRRLQMTIQDLKKFADDLPTSLKAPVENLSRILSGDEIDTNSQQVFNSVNKNINERMGDLNKNNQQDTREYEILSKLKEQTNQIAMRPELESLINPTATINDQNIDLRNIKPRGQQLASATVISQNVANKRAENNNIFSDKNNQSKINETKVISDHEVTVNVKGVCIDCGKKMHEDSQRTATNVTTRK